MSALSDELLMSLQDVGGRIVADEFTKAGEDGEVTKITKDYALLKARFKEKLEKKDVYIFACSVMYPENYEAALEEKLDFLLEELAEINVGGDYDECDFYVMGVGVIQKYVDSRKEKGTFHIGGKYAASFGKLRLVKKAKSEDSGYSLEHPFPLHSVSTEYTLLNRSVSERGFIIKKQRVGSMHGPGGHIVDHWVVDVAGFSRVFIYQYSLYFDPYAEISEEFFAEHPEAKGIPAEVLGIMVDRSLEDTPTGFLYMPVFIDDEKE